MHIRPEEADTLQEHRLIVWPQPDSRKRAAGLWQLTQLPICARKWVSDAAKQVGGGVAYQMVPRVCLHQSHPWSESDPTSVRQGILKWFAMIKCVKTELKSTFHENIVLPRARQFPGNEKSRYFCLLWSSEGSVRLFPPPPTPLTCVWITSLICSTSHCSAILMLYLPTRGRYNDAAALSERGM